MPLRPLPFRDEKRRLEAVGFTESGHRGSHITFAKSTPQGTLIASVPHHREVAAGTLRSILRQAGLSPEEFEQL